MTQLLPIGASALDGVDAARLPEPSPDDPLLDGALADRPLVELRANDRSLLP